MPREVGLEIDPHGWIIQQKGRDAVEVAKEPFQNSLDTGADISARAGYGDNYVTIEDDYEEGVTDLEHFYKVFSGDKRDAHDKRGRFGRGTKEFLASADHAVIQTTSGTAIFDVEIDDDGRYELSGEIYDEDDGEQFCRDSGTYIFAKSDDWNDNQLEEFQDFLYESKVPEGVELEVEHVDRSGIKPERVSEVRTPEQPDYILEGKDEEQEGVALETVVYQDGEKRNPIEPTKVEVYRTEEGEGGIYEMGIPVTQDEDFPFVFNVQQRTPVAEQRDKIDDSYKTILMRSLINENLDLFEDEELDKSYLSSNLSSSTFHIDKETQIEYIERRWADPNTLLLKSRNTTSYAEDKAKQMKTNLEKIIDKTELPYKVKSILEEEVETADQWVNRRDKEEQTSVVEPTEEQREYMELINDVLIGRASIWNVEQEMAEIQGSEGRATKAHHQGNTVRYNVLEEEWEEFKPENVGTSLHEFAHHKDNSGTHGENWYKEMQNLAGEVIVNLFEEREAMREEMNQLREERNLGPVPENELVSQRTREDQDTEQDSYLSRISEIIPF